MNSTPPIFAAATAHGAWPALPKNLSLADLLFADSPSNAASDFRAIAAALFGVDSSTQTQSPANFATSAKKFVAGGSADKTDTRKLKETSDPASSGANAELPVPLENVPVAPIQVSVKPNGGDDRQLNFVASDESTQLSLTGLPGQAGVDNDAKTPNLAEATPDGRVLPSVLPSELGEKGTPMIQPATENALGSRKQLATPIAVSTSGTARKNDVEPAKSPADRPQPAVPQSAKQPASSVATTDRAEQPTDSNFTRGQEKPRVAIDALPPTVPAEQTLNAPANQNLESVADKTLLRNPDWRTPLQQRFPRTQRAATLQIVRRGSKAATLKIHAQRPLRVGSQDSFRRDKSREDRRTQRAMGRIPAVSPFQVIPAPTPSRVL